MRRLVLAVVLLSFLLPSCGPSRYRSGSGTTASVVKPKYHHRWYDRKKDKHTKRTKTIKVKN